MNDQEKQEYMMGRVQYFKDCAVKDFEVEIDGEYGRLKQVILVADNGREYAISAENEGDLSLTTIQDQTGFKVDSSELAIPLRLNDPLLDDKVSGI